MKIKNNKGITMISLVIVILIMLLLASVTAYEANELVAIARVQSVTTDLLLIQAKVRIINEKIVFESDEDKKLELYVGTKLIEGDNVLETMREKSIVTDDDIRNNSYYVLLKEDLLNMGWNESEVADDEKYVVDYNNEEVIYVKGVKNTEGKYLYKLSEMNP